MIWKRPFLLAMLVVTGLVLESAVFGRAPLAGVKPPVLLLVTVALAMGEGPALGAAAGFAAGLAVDAVLELPAGVTALSYALVGYAVGRVRPLVTTPAAWLPIMMVFASTLAGQSLYAGLSALLGERLGDAGQIARTAALAAAYNALLTPFAYPAVQALARRFRPPRTFEGAGA